MNAAGHGRDRSPRRRVDAVLGKGLVSHNALAQILQEFSPNVSTCMQARHKVMRGMERRVNVMTPAGPVLQHVYVPGRDGGADIKIEWVHPVALLYLLSSAVPAFWATVKEVASNRRWHAILYEDGTTAGNLLNVDHEKRCACFIMDMLNLGACA